MTPKTYLGDSVYAEINKYGQVVLTTENDDHGPSNTIFLEPEVWAELVSFVGHAIATRAEREPAAPECPRCENGIIRAVGQDNEEMVEDCPDCRPERRDNA